MNKLLVGASALLFLSVSGCAAGPGKAPPVSAPPAASPSRLTQAIALLDKGDAKGARKRLDDMLRRDPADVSARVLRDSMDADPVAALGKASFTHRIAPGETLLTLSQRFLGSSLKFYALARYNGILIPSQVKPGQVLRIPGQPEPSPAPAPAAGPERAAPARITPAAPRPAQKPPAKAVADPVRAGKLRAAGLAAMNRGQLAQAVSILQQAAKAAPDNALIARDLARALRLQQSVKARQ